MFICWKMLEKEVALERTSILNDLLGKKVSRSNKIVQSCPQMPHAATNNANRQPKSHLPVDMTSRDLPLSLGGDRPQARRKPVDSRTFQVD